MPKLQARQNEFQNGTERYNADMIGVFLDKKIKNEIVKKAEKVMSMNKNSKVMENRNLKRLFAHREVRGTNAMSEIDKRTIASDIVERMSNLKDNPLLIQIEGERRKM